MLEELMQNLETDLNKLMDHLKGEFSRLQIGRASAALVEHMMVESYGSKQQMKGVASISIPDSKTIQIQPWDRGMLAEIEKVIRNSDLNLAPVNDGVVIRLNLPALTEERRKDLAKVVGRLAEESRIGVRHIRQTAQDALKAMHKENKITEDQLRVYEKKLQEKVDKMNVEIETVSKNKEKDIMTV